MNQDKTSILADFVNKNKSTILFWIVIILLLPFILFFISFDFHDLNTISNFGSLGSYLSGTTGFIAAIMTSISVIVLYYTLRITTQYNERQIKHNQTQTITTSFNLLLDSSIKIKESINNSINTNEKYDLIHFCDELTNNAQNFIRSYENIQIEKKASVNSRNTLHQIFHGTDFSLLTEFISNESPDYRIRFKTKDNADEFIKKFAHNHYNINYNHQGLALLIYGMCDMIRKIDNNTLKDTLLILLKSNYHNDFIFYSLASQFENINSSFDISLFCKKPNKINEFLNERSCSSKND